MYIGPYQLSNNLIVAPMAGVTDRPFRTLCKYFGAGHAVSEMMTSDQTLRMTKKSLYRANFDGELAPISAQIAGSEPDQLAEAARYQVANGAQIVDINMGVRFHTNYTLLITHPINLATQPVHHSSYCLVQASD